MRWCAVIESPSFLTKSTVSLRSPDMENTLKSVIETDHGREAVCGWPWELQQPRVFDCGCLGSIVRGVAVGPWRLARPLTFPLLWK